MFFRSTNRQGLKRQLVATRNRILFAGGGDCKKPPHANTKPGAGMQQLKQKARLPASKKKKDYCNFFYGYGSDIATMNDAELVQRVLNGNENAFRFLVAKHQRLVLHVVARVVRQNEDAEDICQEVFLKVFRKIRKFRGDSRLSTWIATIAYNTSISHVRKMNRRHEQPIENHTELERLNKSDFSGPGIEKEEAKMILLKAIEKLPLNYRTVLTLFHLEEFSYREIEEITGMPEGTVKSYLSRARKILKELLEEIIDNEKTNIFADYAER